MLFHRRGLLWLGSADRYNCNFATFNRVVNTRTSRILMGQKWLEHESKPIIVSLADLKGPKGKYILHYGSLWMIYEGDFLGPPHGTTPAAVIANKNKTEIL